MPDVGAPTTLPPSNSHTSTQQWQSFEIRMRHRRAERCVIRAEIALEAGFEEDARAALAEAQRLNSASPDIATIRAALDQRLAVSAAERRTTNRRRVLQFGAIALVLLMSGAAAFWVWTSSPEIAPPQTAPRATVPTVPTVPTGALRAEHTGDTGDASALPPPAVAVQNPAPVTREEAVTERVQPASPEPEPVASRAIDRPPDAGAPAISEPAVLRVPPAPALPEPAPPAVAAPPSVPLERPIERMLGTLPTADVALGTSGAPAAPPAVSPAATPPIIEEPRVRAVLARYETAYSGLNASAAQAVWPGVDGRSLARAFDGLESQRVSLGRCSVTVLGATARAECSGSVSWTPKVGGGEQTASREWRFDLANASGAWQITRADVR